MNIEHNFRPGIGLRPDGLPDILWLDIPGGCFTLGNVTQNSNPIPSKIMLRAFKIAAFPVTHKQFQAFIDSGEFNDARWWRKMPETCQPDEMAEQDNPFYTHPRDSVSWYQAVAFARWLNAKYQEIESLAITLEAAKRQDETINDSLNRSNNQNGVTWTIRLPTEQEWEFAARGSDGRQYPYSADFDAKKCNTLESGIGETTAVGTFPDGASPFGVLDMCGNVLEWCMNDYWNPEIIDGYGTGSLKVLRGGSFDTFHYHATCTHRFDGYPSSRFNSFGFRLVLGSPI